MRPVAAAFRQVAGPYHQVMSPRSVHRLAGVVIAVLLASACSSEPSEPRAADASRPAPVTATSPTADRSTPAVLRFTAPRLGGGTIDGEDLAGRDVAFWFWAPW